MENEPLTIYLVDPIHNYITSRDNWMIPLCVLSIAAFTKKLFARSVNIRCFKFPDLLLDAIDRHPPDVIASSNYIWNAQLANFLLKYAKTINPRTLAVLGGPNITATPQAMTRFLRNSSCDIYVEGPGEYAFAMLVQALLEGCASNEIFHHDRVQSVWVLNSKTGMAERKTACNEIIALDEIPSPYLTGMAFDFFEQGLLPMLETNRGCPHSCTYCVWGQGNKVRHFSTLRVEQELDYCRRHAPGKLLMINDANFGLYPRDIDISRTIKKIHDEHGWPETVVVNWGQVWSDDALKVAEAMKGICYLRQSSQSLNPEVLKNIKRKNIGLQDWKKILSFSKSQGLETFGELILMLPGESFQSYMDGLRFLFDLDVDCINTNQLQLLEGARIHTPEEREKYGMRTKWRLIENAYGVYRDSPVVEGVELVVATNTFSEEDCLLCRPLVWLIQTSWTMRWHDLLLRFMACLGVNPADFLLTAIQNHHAASKPVRSIFDRFLQDTRAELFESHDKLVEHYSKLGIMDGLRQGQFKKLNTHYCAEILSCPEEFLEYYESIALSMVDNLQQRPEEFQRIVHDCCRYLRHRFLDAKDLAAIENNITPQKNVSFDYDWHSWTKQAELSQLLNVQRDQRYAFSFSTSKNQVKALQSCMEKFKGISREYQLRKLLEPYYGIPREYLMFTVQSIT